MTSFQWIPSDTKTLVSAREREHWGHVFDGGLLDVLSIVGLVGQVSVVWVWDLVGVTLTIA